MIMFIVHSSSVTQLNAMATDILKDQQQEMDRVSHGDMCKNILGLAIRYMYHGKTMTQFQFRGTGVEPENNKILRQFTSDQNCIPLCSFFPCSRFDHFIF